jgi:hypothetical protein
MNETYTISFTRVGDHLAVQIAELSITLETDAGKTSREDALDAAQQAIIRYQLARQERAEVKAS